MNTTVIPSTLQTEGLIKDAQNIAGLNDFGDYVFETPLTKLVQSTCENMVLTEEGIAGFRQDLIRCLVNRLRMQNDLRKHPEILEEDVSDPIVILGLGRSGTTKMHKMLSMPDTVQKTYMWRMLNPARFPDVGLSAKSDEVDPRIAAAGTSDLISTESAVVRAAHRMEAQEVEEEWLLYQMTFDDWIWSALLFVPSYFDWTMSRPSLPVYEYIKTVLKYLQWQDSGKQGRRWVLKSVGYLADLDVFNHCYPNAIYLHTHREPRDTIPSWAKFVSGIWASRAEPIAPKLVGQEVLRSWSLAMKRYLDARSRLGIEDRILDVPYEKVREDPMSIIRNLYKLGNIPLTPELDAKMASWHKSNEQYKNGRHAYSLEEFGLSNEQIDNAFAGYIGRFISRK